MMIARGFVTRPYQADDEEQVLKLLAATLPGWARARSGRVDLWRWKHAQNPFGPSRIQVAWDEQMGVVGVLAMMRWKLRRGDRIIRAARGVELATHPDYRGRGIAIRLSRELGEEVEVDGTSILFSTPNHISLAFSLRRGRRFLGVISPSLRVRRIVRYLTGRLGLHARDPADRDFTRHLPTQALSAESWMNRGGLERLLEDDARVDRFGTHRTAEYLRWRYVEHPLERYYALNVEERGELLGSVIFRAASGTTANRIMIQEILLKRRDQRAAKGLRTQLQQLKDVDFFLGCVSHDPMERAVLGRAAFRVPRSGYQLTVGVFDDECAEARQLSAWGLTLGDLEGF